MLNARSVAAFAALPLALVVGCDVGDTVAGGSGGSGGAGGSAGQGTTASSGSGTTGTGNSTSVSSSTTSSGTASTTSSTAATSSSSTTSSGGTTSGLHVEGNKLVDNGQTVRLLGVDQSGTEYQCTHRNAGFFDVGGGAPDGQFVTNMKAWNINAVRVPLNEDCWLGINGSRWQQRLRVPDGHPGST